MAKTKTAQALTNVQVLDEDTKPKGIQLSTIAEIGVSTGDVVTIAVSEFERRVNAKITEGARLVANIDQQLADARHDLTTKLQDAVKKHTSPIVTSGQKFYADRGLKFDHEKELVFDETSDTESFGVHYRLFSDKVRYTGYGQQKWNYSDEVEYTDAVTFDAAGATDLLKRLRDLKTARAKAVQIQTEWRQRLSNVISVERQTRGELAKAMLQETPEGRNLSDAIMANFEERFFGGAIGYDDEPLLRIAATPAKSAE